MTDTMTPVEAWNDWIEGDLAEVKLEAMPALYEPGTNDRVLLITGENAGGKSMTAEILGTWAYQMAKLDGVGLEIMDLGMKRRTTSGIERGFIFGSEPQGESTGHVSVHVALSALENSRKRQGPHWLVLDEPDVGLGDGYHAALGRTFAAFAEELPDLCRGFVVVTHSRIIASSLVGAGAASLRIGPDLRPVRRWLQEGDVEKTESDLAALAETVHLNRKRITAMLREVTKKDRDEAPGGGGPRR
jgi:hypothetical protein